MSSEKHPTPPILREGDGKTTRTEYTVQAVAVPKRPIFRFFKRLFDICFALFGLLILLLPMCIIAICIRIDSRGPAIYSQERTGYKGKIFTLYKFRSMVSDAEKNGAVWASENDSRVTRVGKFLRSSRLDEIPQLLNILFGQMSLIGPRPERPVFYEEFEGYIHGFSNRLAVKPGLTGWAQVNGGYDLLPEEKVVYDMEYIKDYSLSMDVKCFFKTFSVVLGRKGAR